MIAAVPKFLAVLTDIIFNFRAFWAIGSVEAIHAAAFDQIMFDPVEHHVGHFAVANALIAVIAILIVLMKINIIQAGAAVEHTVINDETFKMQYAEGFAGIHRHAVNRDINARIFLRHAAVPVGVGVGCRSANAPALGSVPVNQDTNI